MHLAGIATVAFLLPRRAVLVVSALIAAWMVLSVQHALAQSMDTVLAMPKPSDTAAMQPTSKDAAAPASNMMRTLLRAGFAKSLRAPAISKPEGPTNVRVEIRDDNADASANMTMQPPAVEDQALRGDFDVWVEQHIGRRLPILGQDLFPAKPSNLPEIDARHVPGDYTIGIGDELEIRTSGQVELDLKVTVDRQGRIHLPTVGALPVAGTPYGQLPDTIRNALSRYYKGFEVSASLGPLRGIRIMVSGYAKKPGMHLMSPLSTFLNAVMASGGASPAGNIRRIELIRGGRTIAYFDAYELLRSGRHTAGEQRLLPGDTIHIPPLAGHVAIHGSVNLPSIQQLAAGMSLRDAIDLAGGLTTLAGASKVVIERTSAARQRFSESFDLDDAAMRQPLRDGDIVTIAPMSLRLMNTVTLRGNVALPVRAPWKPGMRVLDLIPGVDALVSADWWRARQAAAFALTQRSTGNDETLRLKFPEIHWEYAVIERLEGNNLQPTLIAFHLGEAILQKNPEHNVLLEPGDAVVVFAKKDFRQPVSSQTKFVRIEGEIQRPGIYAVGKGENLAHLIERAGGVTPDGWLLGTELRRESAKIRQRERINETINRLEGELNRGAITRMRNVMQIEEATLAASESEAVDKLIKQLRNMTPKGRIVLDFPRKLADGSVGLPESELEHDDVVVVPVRPTTIEVVGAVYNENSFQYRSGKRLNEYLQQAGGVTPTGTRDTIQVLRTDGTVLTGVNNWVDLLPGDVVMVPEKLDRVNFSKHLRDWTQILYQFGLGAASLKVLKGN